MFYLLGDIMAEYIKKCRTCTTKFVAKKKNTKYCSDYCRKRAYHLKKRGIYLGDLEDDQKIKLMLLKKGTYLSKVEL